MHSFVAGVVQHWWIVFSNLNVKRIMGLFDAIFGSSKKEQEKPIRDKLKGRKHFEKWLKDTLQEIAEDESSILKAKESGNEVNTFLYYTPVRDKDLLRIAPIAYSFQYALAVPRAYSRRNSMLPVPHRDS